MSVTPDEVDEALRELGREPLTDDERGRLLQVRAALAEQIAGDERFGLFTQDGQRIALLAWRSAELAILHAPPGEGFAFVKRGRLIASGSAPGEELIAWEDGFWGGPERKEKPDGETE